MSLPFYVIIGGATDFLGMHMCEFTILYYRMNAYSFVTVVSLWSYCCDTHYVVVHVWLQFHLLSSGPVCVYHPHLLENGGKACQRQFTVQFDVWKPPAKSVIQYFLNKIKTIGACWMSMEDDIYNCQKEHVGFEKQIAGRTK